MNAQCKRQKVESTKIMEILPHLEVEPWLMLILRSHKEQSSHTLLRIKVIKGLPPDTRE